MSEPTAVEVLTEIRRRGMAAGPDEAELGFDYGVAAQVAADVLAELRTRGGARCTTCDGRPWLDCDNPEHGEQCRRLCPTCEGASRAASHRGMVLVDAQELSALLQVLEHLDLSVAATTRCRGIVSRAVAVTRGMNDPLAQAADGWFEVVA